MDKKKIGAGLLAMFVSLLPLAAQQSAEKSGEEMDRISICQDNYRALFGGEALTGQGNDREMMDILQKFIFGEVFTAGPLEVKTRELITCTVLTTIQTLPQLKAHAAAALRVGVSPVELHEAVYQCAPFIGFPRTLNALSVLEQVFRENGIDLPLPPQGTVNEENRYEKGREIQQRLYGDRMARQLSGVPGGLGDRAAEWLTGYGFGDIYTRGGLDLQTRELLTFCVLTALDADEALHSHVEGNLKAGNSREELAAAVLQCLPYVGFPPAIKALKALRNAEAVPQPR